MTNCKPFVKGQVSDIKSQVNQERWLRYLGYLMGVSTQNFSISKED